MASRVYPFSLRFFSYVPCTGPWAMGGGAECEDSGADTIRADHKKEMAESVARFKVAFGSNTARAVSAPMFLFLFSIGS